MPLRGYIMTNTDIANMALASFGGGRITSLDDNSESARLISLNFDNCADTVLRAFPWNFARRIDLLGLTAETLGGWDYVYQYPPDCLNVLKIYSSGNTRLQTRDKFKIYTNGTTKLIACDVEDAYIEYTMSVTDVNMYDQCFAKALSYLLAAEVCNAKTGNTSKSQEMLKKYNLTINNALTAGANENNVQEDWPTSYTRGRR